MGGGVPFSSAKFYSQPVLPYVSSFRLCFAITFHAFVALLLACRVLFCEREHARESRRVVAELIPWFVLINRCWLGFDHRSVHVFSSLISVIFSRVGFLYTSTCVLDEVPSHIEQ